MAEGAPLSPPIAPDTPAWFAWLADVSSFSFQRASGDIYTLRKEKVQRGGAYWYAYHRADGRMTKRYIGRDTDLTLARLAAAPSTARYVTKTNEEHRQARTTRSAARSDSSAAEHAAAGDTHADAPHPRPRGEPHTRLAPFAARHGASADAADRAAGFWQDDRAGGVGAPGGDAVAWVSLDVSDNEPGQFWAYILSALEQASPGVTGGALEMLRSMQAPPLPIILRALLNALVASPRHIVLVLDDYHSHHRTHHPRDTGDPARTSRRNSFISIWRRAASHRCRWHACARVTR